MGWGGAKECHTVLCEVGERARGGNLLHEIEIKKKKEKKTATSVWELQTPFERENVIPFGILWLGKQPGFILEVSLSVCVRACVCLCVFRRVMLCGG